MDNLKDLKIDIVDRVIRLKPFFVEHGHELNIQRSYQYLSSSNDLKGDNYTVNYVWETGNLFLKTKEALELQKVIVIKNGFDHNRLN